MTHKSDVTPRRYAELGKRLQAAREAVRLSRPDVAREVVPGAKRKAQTVYEWEAGVATPSVAQLTQLCRLYRVTADSLLGLPESDAATLLKIAGKVVAGRLGEALVELLPTLRPALSADVAATVEQAARQWEQEQGPDDATGEGRG